MYPRERPHSEHRVYSRTENFCFFACLAIHDFFATFRCLLLPLRGRTAVPR